MVGKPIVCLHCLREITRSIVSKVEWSGNALFNLLFNFPASRDQTRSITTCGKCKQTRSGAEKKQKGCLLFYTVISSYL